MDTADFDRRLGELTASLGNATRRGIYIAARESSEPLTAPTVAAAFGIHPNVARHHLERLVRDGYLTVSPRRAPSRKAPRTGRPAKGYTVSQQEIDLRYPTRRMDLLAALLLEVIDELGPGRSAEMARTIGFRYGSRVAGEIGLPTDEGFEGTVRAVARVMTGIGFGVEADPGRSRLITNHCPFGDMATRSPEVVCSLDQGLLDGLMGKLDRRWEPVLFPRSTVGEVCMTEVRC